MQASPDKSNLLVPGSPYRDRASHATGSPEGGRRLADIKNRTLRIRLFINRRAPVFVQSLRENTQCSSPTCLTYSSPRAARLCIIARKPKVQGAASWL